MSNILQTDALRATFSFKIVMYQRPSSLWPEEEINILSTPADVEIGIAVHLPEVACVQQDRPAKKRLAVHYS